MSAAELLHEVFDQGIHLIVEDNSIRCRSTEPLSRELIVRLKTHKAEIITLLEFQKRLHGKPYLINGELRVAGLLPPGAMLDTLIELKAPDDVIERHIHPIGTPYSWQRWETIKADRKPH